MHSVLAGIAGYNWDGGVIRRCYNSGLLISSGNGNMSGLVGHNLGLVEESFNNGNFETYYFYSISTGLVGDNRGTVRNCYSTGNITSYYEELYEEDYEYPDEHLYGLVRYNFDGIIENTYTIGKIRRNDNAKTKGTIIYLNDSENPDNIKNLFYLNGSTKYVLGNSYTSDSDNFTGKTEVELKNLAPTLGSSWTTNNNINNGFPILKWQVK